MSFFVKVLLYFSNINVLMSITNCRLDIPVCAALYIRITHKLVILDIQKLQSKTAVFKIQISYIRRSMSSNNCCWLLPTFIFPYKFHLTKVKNYRY